MIHINRNAQLVIFGMGLGVMLLSAVRDLAGGGAESFVGGGVLLAVLYMVAVINGDEDGEDQ